MTFNISHMPNWPRYLTREQAAAYVGVSTDTFDIELKESVWPAPFKRGASGGRLTWDRLLLDSAADDASAITSSAAAPIVETAPLNLIALMKERVPGGQAKRKRA